MKASEREKDLLYACSVWELLPEAITIIIHFSESKLALWVFLGTKYFPSVTSEKDGNRSATHKSNISSCFKENSETLSKSKVSPRNNASPKDDRTSTVAVRLNANSTTVSMVILFLCTHV